MPWQNYILFIEDIEIDIEDLHRIIIALEARGIFSKIKAVVIGVMNEGTFESNWSKLNVVFGKRVKVEHIFEYLVRGVIETREYKKSPLYILQVDNFGHGIFKDQMIVPIGGKTIIHPNAKIEFIGPFVE
jgi:muramoyltetrapeptide carboxypeptidase LdcA involved in peptidoglycan recycling